MEWTVELKGGPRRVNHAAVQLGGHVYSFGGYCSGEQLRASNPIDVHRLDTLTYRWHKVHATSASCPSTSSLAGSSSGATPSSSNSSILTLLSDRVARRQTVRLSDDEDESDLRQQQQQANAPHTWQEENLFAWEPEPGEAPPRYLPLHGDLHHRQLLQNARLGQDFDMMEDEDDGREFDDREEMELDEQETDRDENDDNDSDNDLDPADMEENRRRHEAGPGADVPYQRYGHTVVAYNGRAYLWGGRNDEFGASTLLHEFDPVTNTWRVISHVGQIVPAARDGHSAVIHNGRMLVFGGFEEEFQRFSQETFAFDFKTRQWSELQVLGTLPRWRDFHTAVVIDDCMWVFGGRSDQMGEYHSTRDVYDEGLHCLNLKTLTWTLVTSTGKAPNGRRSHSAWVYNKKMYIFGGYLGTMNHHFGDLHEFDPKTSTWRMIEPFGTHRPSARRRQCTVLVDSRVFLFGGTKPDDRPATYGGGFSQPQSLCDIADLYVLDFQPTLMQLCLRRVIDQYFEHGRTTTPREIGRLLPREVRHQLIDMVRPNPEFTSTRARRGLQSG